MLVDPCRSLCTHSKVFLSPIQQDYDASRLDPMSISEHVWFGTGVGDIVRRRLGGVHEFPVGPLAISCTEPDASPAIARLPNR